MYNNRGMRLDKVYFHRRVKTFMNISKEKMYNLLESRSFLNEFIYS